MAGMNDEDEKRGKDRLSPVVRALLMILAMVLCLGSVLVVMMGR